MSAPEHLVRRLTHRRVGFPCLLTLKKAEADAATRVIKRKTNRRHMIGDHHGQTLGEQLS